MQELCHQNLAYSSHDFGSFLNEFVPDYQRKIDWSNRNAKNMSLLL
jgi:hypothetical protein